MTPLYKRSNTGALLVWIIDVASSTLITHHGQVGGAIQESRDLIRYGKNLGRSNETTPQEQAQAEALARWTKKKDREGYVEDAARAAKGETDQEGGIAPMLAQPWEKVQKKFRFPADAQRKLDGCRCIAVVKDGKASLWSRKRAPIHGVPHVVAALEKMDLGNATLDGELFVLGMGFQQITSFVRTTGTKPGYEQLQYHVYDLPGPGPWIARRQRMTEIVFNDVVRCVETWTVSSYTLVQEFHDLWVQEGYEGLILRSHDALYEAGKRSAHLVKVKAFDDSEYRIVGVNEGRGKFQGLAMFRCRTPEGKEFDCCAPGSLDKRREYLAQGQALVGQFLTVKYFGLTDDGLPRFPVGKGLRWAGDT